MKTILFLDVENMGGKKVRLLVDGIIREYAPSEKMMVYSKKTILSPYFREDLHDWKIVRCKPGRNAADKVIQQHMMEAAKANDIGRVILITSDHGFAAACRRILDSGKELLLFVKHGVKLVRKIATHVMQHFSVLKISDSLPASDSSVFLKMQDGSLREVPFKEGMLLETFCKHLKSIGLHRKHMVRWMNTCMLTVRKNRVFVKESCFWDTDPVEILFQGVSETPEFF